MAGNNNLTLLLAGVVLSVLLGTPSFAPAKEEAQKDTQTFRMQVVQSLNLRSDKAGIFIKIEEKYDRIRQEAIERINQSVGQLEKLMSGAQPDEKKMKELKAAIASDQDILVNTYKGRRDEILAILTPNQQSEYLLLTWKWQQKLLQQYGKEKTAPQTQGDKAKAP